MFYLLFALLFCFLGVSLGVSYQQQQGTSGNVNSQPLLQQSLRDSQFVRLPQTRQQVPNRMNQFQQQQLPQNNAAERQYKAQQPHPNRKSTQNKQNNAFCGNNSDSSNNSGSNKNKYNSNRHNPQ
jgi:hypothetical protein